MTPLVAAGDASPLETALEGVVRALVIVLERHPEVIERLRALVVPESTQLSSKFMSVQQYAAHRAVSLRTIRYDVAAMQDGVEYDRAGRKGGRIVISVEAADAWYRRRDKQGLGATGIEQLAVDEVTRRRARVALKKNKEK